MLDNRLRHFLGLFLSLVTCHPGLASASPEQKISFSVSGGIGYLADVEWFRSVRSHDLELVGEVLGSSFSVAKDGYAVERVLPEFYLEAAYRPTSRLSLGAGAGYSSQKWILTGRFERRTFIPEDTANFHFSHDARMTYVPVYLFAAYDALMTRTASFGVRAAVGYDILRLDYVYNRDNTYFSRLDGAYKDYREKVTQESAGTEAWGLRLALCGERRLTDALATFITVEFRVAPLGEVFGSAVRTATLKSNDRLVYDIREVLPREPVQPGHRFGLTGPVVRGGLKVGF